MSFTFTWKSFGTNCLKLSVLYNLLHEHHKLPSRHVTRSELKKQQNSASRQLSCLLIQDKLHLHCFQLSSRILQDNEKATVMLLMKQLVPADILLLCLEVSVLMTWGLQWDMDGSRLLNLVGI
jgi:hypothetical protein